MSTRVPHCLYALVGEIKFIYLFYLFKNVVVSVVIVFSKKM